MKLAILVGDCHRSHHHVKAYGLMMKVAHDLQPDEFILEGDYVDFYWLSRHKKDPRVKQTVIDEINSANQGLDEIDQCLPRSKKVYLMGNHEHRLENYINERCLELYGLISYTGLVGLDRRYNWETIHYHSEQKYQILGSKLFARHTPNASNAKATVNRAMANITYGHIHRIEESQARSLTGETFVAFSCGWLGDARKNEVFGYLPAQNQWQLGFGLVYYDEDTKIFYKQIIQIADDITCVVNGKKYKG